MEKYAGGVAAHRAAEGKEVLLDYRGPVEGTLQDILGGVRSACTYVGARRLRELSKIVPTGVYSCLLVGIAHGAIDSTTLIVDDGRVVLEVQEVSKHFGGLKAVDQVSFSVR